MLYWGLIVLGLGRKTFSSNNKLVRLLAITLLVCICINITVCFCVNVADKYAASGSSYSEYKVKVGFLYHFLKFINCPKWKQSEDKKPIIVAIIGDNPFGENLGYFKNKKIGKREITVRDLGNFDNIDNKKMLIHCEVLYICDSEEKHVDEILQITKNENVMTVSDIDGFIDKGGLINFKLKNKKLQFDINQAVAKSEGFYISSKLLRLAQK